MTARLLAGPPLAAGPESLADHTLRLGRLPGPEDGLDVVALLDAAGLLGRGGAGFPVARKWTTVAGRAGGGAVVLANGAEGEPLSSKDRVLMSTRPHLVLDGAELAASVVGADRIVLYVGSEHVAARKAMRRALDERLADVSRIRTRIPIEIVAAPATYISGEESAAVHFVNEGDARPTSTPPRPFERGIDGLPTLVQNVESLAHAALIARFGDGWYREAGRGRTRGTALVTIGGAPRPGVTEIEIGTTLAEVARRAGFQADRRSGPAGRVLRRLGGGQRRVADAARPAGPSRERCLVRLRHRVVPGRRRLWGPRVGPDPRLHGGRERRPVRTVRVRAAGDRRCHGPAGHRTPPWR